MKITDVRTVPVSNYLFVQVVTNEGITGLGESGTWGFLEASAVRNAAETRRRAVH
jgi:galactonate dehydratase